MRRVPSAGIGIGKIQISAGLRVALDARLTVPTVNPAAVIAADAAACVKATTFGTMMLTVFETVTEIAAAVAVLPASSRAIAVNACAPFALAAVFHAIE